MKEIIDKAEDLAEVLRNCDCYASYAAALDEIKNNPELISKIKAFRKANIDYKTKLMQNSVPKFDEEKYVSSLYAELMLIKPCRDFIQSEKMILEVLSNIFNTINSSCTLEFDIFE